MPVDAQTTVAGLPILKKTNQTATTDEGLPILKKKQATDPFSHSYQPTPQDTKQKQSFADLESGFDKSQGGSNPSQNIKTTPAKGAGWDALVSNQRALRQKNDPVAYRKAQLNDPSSEYYQQRSKEIAEQNKPNGGSWANLPAFAANKVFSGLEKDIGSVANFAGDYLPNGAGIGAKAIAYSALKQAKKDEQRAQQNQLPNTPGGRLASQGVAFLPDAVELALTPELDVTKLGKLGEVITKYGGKYGTKAADLAVGKFPIQQSAKNFIETYSDARQNGQPESDALGDATKAGLKGYGQGVLYEAGGEAAGAGTKKILKSLPESGSKVVQGAAKRLLNASAQATVFSAIPFVENAVQGKPTSMDEVKDNALFGFVMGGLLHGKHEDDEPTTGDKASAAILQRKPVIDLGHFMDTDIEDIKAIHNAPETAAELSAKATNHAEQGFHEEDNEKKQEHAVQSGINERAAAVKGFTNAVLKDKQAVIDGINELPIPDEVKQPMIDKVNQVHKELDPNEQKKTTIGKQITELDAQIGEKSDDPVTNAENEVKREKSKELNNQLKQLIQQQNESNEKRVSENGQKEGQANPTQESGGESQENEERNVTTVAGGDEPPVNENHVKRLSEIEKELIRPKEKPQSASGEETDITKSKVAFKKALDEIPDVYQENVETETTRKLVNLFAKVSGRDATYDGPMKGSGYYKFLQEQNGLHADSFAALLNDPVQAKKYISDLHEKFYKNISENTTADPIKQDTNYLPDTERKTLEKERDELLKKQKGEDQDAINQVKEQKSSGQEHQEGDKSGQAEKAGDSNSPERATEKPRYKIKGTEVTPVEHVELNNILQKEDGITISHLKNANNTQRDESGDRNAETPTNAKTVQQPENDGTGNAGENRSGQSDESGKGTKSKTTFKKPPAKILTDAEEARRIELRKKFSGTFRTGVPGKELFDKEFYEYAGLVFKEAKGEFKQFAKTLIDEVGEKIREHLPHLWQKAGGDAKDIPEESGNEVKKTILTKRAYEGEVQDDVKKHLEEKGLTRKSFSQEERSKQATQFIDKFGDNAAYRAVEAGDIDGALAASTLAQLQIRNSEAIEDLPEGSPERDELAKKHADLIALMEKKGYFSGEFIGQLAHEYQNKELNFASIKRQVEKLTGKSLTKEQEAKVKETVAENEKLKSKLQEAEAKLIEETDKAFKAGAESVKGEKKADRAKRIATNLRALKITSVNESTLGIPIAFYNGAIETTATIIENGGKVADAIDAGLEHIRESDWYKGLSGAKQRKTESDYKSHVYENAPSSELSDLQHRFVDKTDNKFTHSEAKDIWGYMKEKYLNNGVSYHDALSKTTADLGLTWRQVSEAIVTPKLKRVSDEMWKRQSELARNRSAIKNWIGEQSSSAPVRALKKISGLFRGVAVFAHGHIFLGTHAGMTFFNPSTWNKTIPAFFRGFKLAYGKEADYAKAMEELKNSPNYLIAQRAGLKNDPDRINTEEYQKSQQYLGKLGKVGERGFNTIKVLRQALFDYHFNKLSPEERDDPEVAKNIAKLMNLATGATNLKLPSWVNEATFAGGMESARWGKLLSSPAKATQTALNAIFAPEKATVADRVFAKVWARRVGEQLATYMAARTANAVINNYLFPQKKEKVFDPSDPEWWKFKFWDTTIDPTSGMRSTAAFIHTLGSVMVEDKKQLHGDSRLAVEGKKGIQYARGKLAPLYGTVADFAGNRDFSGNVMPKFPIDALNRDDKPNKYQHQLDWWEYTASKAPLPMAEGFGVFYQSALEHGAKKKTLDRTVKAIIAGVVSGSTGFRVGENHSKKGMKKVELLKK